MQQRYQYRPQQPFTGSSQLLLALQAANFSENDIDFIRQKARTRQYILQMTREKAMHLIDDIQEIECIVFKNERRQDARLSRAVVLQIIMATRAINKHSKSITKLKRLLQKTREQQDFFYLQFVEDILTANNGIIVLKKIINHFALLKNRINMTPKDILSLCVHDNSWSELQALIKYYFALLAEPYQLTREQIFHLLRNDNGAERIDALIAAVQYIQNHDKAADMAQLFKKVCVSLNSLRKPVACFIAPVEDYVNKLCASTEDEFSLNKKRAKIKSKPATGNKSKTVKRKSRKSDEFVPKKKRKAAESEVDVSLQTASPPKPPLPTPQRRTSISDEIFISSSSEEETTDCILSLNSTTTSSPVPQNNDGAARYQQPVALQDLKFFRPSINPETCAPTFPQNNLFPICSKQLASLQIPGNNSYVFTSTHSQPAKPTTASASMSSPSFTWDAASSTGSSSYQHPIEDELEDDLFSACWPLMFPNFQYQQPPTQVSYEKPKKTFLPQVPSPCFFQPSQSETQDDRQIPAPVFL